MVEQNKGNNTLDVGMEQLWAAQSGSARALGEVLELSRQYLLAIANSELPGHLQGKFGASDLVQQTYLEAQRDFGGFTGTTQADLFRWLRRIMLNNVANVVRDYCQTQKRRVGTEIPLSASGLGRVMDPGPSASSRVVAAERLQALQEALGQLPEAYAQVIRWRNNDRLGFEEIGRRLGRSAEAARKLWVRALDQLREKLDVHGAGHDH